MPEPMQTIQIDVLRYRPEQEDAPVWQSYQVPFSRSEEHTSELQSQ